MGVRRWLLAALLLAAAACTDAQAQPPCRPMPTCRNTTTSAAATTTTTTEPAASSTSGTGSTTTIPAVGDVLVTAAGDIAGSGSQADQTASLIMAAAPTAALTLGDNAYPDGSLSEYQTYYDSAWGAFKQITRPAPGNHDYHTSNAQGMRDYFGPLWPADYYSFDLGGWHLISLDGEVAHAAGSAQETWLAQDLAATTQPCVLAYWHEPRWSSGTVHGSNSGFDGFWRDLYAAHADIVLNGHEHNYERFAKQNPGGQTDPAGVREFVVGTGGEGGNYTFGTPLPTSEKRIGPNKMGVLSLTLHTNGYDWAWQGVAGVADTDAGSDTCH